MKEKVAGLASRCVDIVLVESRCANSNHTCLLKDHSN